jgi:hypothetical protein
MKTVIAAAALAVVFAMPAFADNAASTAAPPKAVNYDEVAAANPYSEACKAGYIAEMRKGALPLLGNSEPDFARWMDNKISFGEMWVRKIDFAALMGAKMGVMTHAHDGAVPGCDNPTDKQALLKRIDAFGAVLPGLLGNWFAAGVFSGTNPVPSAPADK